MSSGHSDHLVTWYLHVYYGWRQTAGVGLLAGSCLLAVSPWLSDLSEMLPRSGLTPDSVSRPCWLSRCCCWRILGPRLRCLDHNREQRLGVSTKIHCTQNSLLWNPKWPQLDELATLKSGRVIYFSVKLNFIASLFCINPRNLNCCSRECSISSFYYFDDLICEVVFAFSPFCIVLSFESFIESFC